MRLRIRRITGILPTSPVNSAFPQMWVDVEMTEGQMLDAVLEFQTKITDATWAEWLKILDTER